MSSTAEPQEDPFVVLAIAPTADAAQVKRAYFAALKRHPPHADPAGFRRVRAAYDRLSAPGALATMSWSNTFDRRAAAQALEALLRPRLEARGAAISAAEGERELRDAFERKLLAASWAEAAAAFADDAALERAQ
jgi:hypothetical protein